MPVVSVIMRPDKNKTFYTQFNRACSTFTLGAIDFIVHGIRDFETRM